MAAVLPLSGVTAFVPALLNLRRGRSLACLLRPGEVVYQPARFVERLHVSILAPCRGIDSHFEAHSRALLSQQYPHYTVLFIVGSRADPAWHELNPKVALWQPPFRYLRRSHPLRVPSGRQ